MIEALWKFMHRDRNDRQRPRTMLDLRDPIEQRIFEQHSAVRDSIAQRKQGAAITRPARQHHLGQPCAVRLEPGRQQVLALDQRLLPHLPLAGRARQFKQRTEPVVAGRPDLDERRVFRAGHHAPRSSA